MLSFSLFFFLKIKRIARQVALDPQFGDMSPHYTAYDAMFSSLYGDPSFVRMKNSTFTELFASICSPKFGMDEGCALFAVNFYGEDDRTMSKYQYQVRIHDVCC
jgi:hypothetical protein